MKLVSELIIRIIRFYQLTLSVVLGPRCRFYPSCSSYAIEAIEKHGIAKGAWLAVRRISRCHPFNPGGVDPVPESYQACSHADPGSAEQNLVRE